MTTDFEGLIHALADNGVEFIIVGGFAATVHGASRLTTDLDVVYERSPENMQRLAQAIGPLQPYPRGAPPGLPYRFDAATLRNGMNFVLTSQLGWVDLLGEIAGGGYPQLRDCVDEIEVFGLRCRCLQLGKLIEVKRAAGRPKDFEAIAELEALAEES